MATERVVHKEKAHQLGECGTSGGMCSRLRINTTTVWTKVTCKRCLKIYETSEEGGTNA